MTLRDLFILTRDDTTVIIKDAADDTLYYSGKFQEVPFKFMKFIVMEIRPIGNTLVVSTYD